LNLLTLNLESFFYYGDFWFQVSAFVKIFDSLAQGLFWSQQNQWSSCLIRQTFIRQAFRLF